MSGKSGKQVKLAKKKYNSFTRFFAVAKAKIKNLKWDSPRLPVGTKSIKLSFDVEGAEGGEEATIFIHRGFSKGDKELIATLTHKGIKADKDHVELEWTLLPCDKATVEVGPDTSMLDYLKSESPQTGEQSTSSEQSSSKDSGLLEYTFEVEIDAALEESDEPLQLYKEISLSAAQVGGEPLPVGCRLTWTTGDGKKITKALEQGPLVFEEVPIGEVKIEVIGPDDPDLGPLTNRSTLGERMKYYEVSRFLVTDAAPADELELIVRLNEIIPVVDGPNIFEKMGQAMESAEGYIYITAWLLHLNVRLGKKSLKRWLLDKARDEVKVRILWCDLDQQMGHFGKNVSPRLAADWERYSARNLLNSAEGEGIAPEYLQIVVSRMKDISSDLESLQDRAKGMSDQQVLVLGSHHQKSVIVDGYWGFCSGCDLTVDTANKEKWHDTSILTKGAGVRGLEDNFVERWNDERKDMETTAPDEVEGDEELPQENKGPLKIANGRIMTRPILFAAGKEQLQGASNAALEKVAATLSNNPWIKRLQIEGHSDSAGDDAKNLALSQKRAESVCAALKKMGVSGGRIAAKGFGEQFPIASNKTQTGRRQNRRVAFVVLDPALKRTQPAVKKKSSSGEEAYQLPPVSRLSLNSQTKTSKKLKVIRTMGLQDRSDTSDSGNNAKSTTTEIRSAYLSSIKKAKDYIFLVNQYLRHPEVGEELVEAAERGTNILILVPRMPEEAKGRRLDIQTKIGVYSQYKILRQLQPFMGSGVVRVLSPARRNRPYIHTKALITDDKRAVVGSANANGRSLDGKSDTELNVDISDPLVVEALLGELTGRFGMGREQVGGKTHFSRGALVDHNIENDNRISRFDQNDMKERDDFVELLEDKAGKFGSWVCTTFYSLGDLTDAKDLDELRDAMTNRIIQYL